MNATTINTNAQDTTVADLLAQTTDISAELVQQAPVAETTSVLTGKVGVAVDAVKTAAGASLDFLQEHKTAVVFVASATAAAGAGYAIYKWYAKRWDAKRAKDQEADKAAAKAAADAEEAAKTAEEAAAAATKAAAENM